VPGSALHAEPGSAPRTVRAVEWAAGAVAAVAVLGPALGSGSLLNLDLVVTRHVRLPSAAWGLGPDLPRRVPYGVPLAWIGSVLGGEVTGKLLLGACIAIGLVGVGRLAAGAGVVARLGAGMVYALSPWLLTRVAVGHLAIVLAAAMLPWALPRLLRPDDSPARTVVWGAALGLCGPYGGLVAGAAIAVGVVADRGRGAGRTVLLFVAGQLPWIVPSGILVGEAGAFAGPEHFRTDAGPLTGTFRIAAGHGFWLPPNQVGGRGGPGVVVLGAVLLGLAAMGHSRLPAWRDRALSLGLIGLLLSIASAVPGLRGLVDAGASTVAGAPLREGQRAALLLLVWMAPAASLGAVRVLGSPGRVAAAGVALALAAPGLWGAEGALDPVRFPAAWHEADRAIEREPGPVLAVPWHEYLDVSFAGGRRVLNPMPDFFGGDVLSSTDPELGPPRHEGADPREGYVDAVVADARAGRHMAARLVDVGVRWIVVAHEADWQELTGIRGDPGLELVVAGAELDAYRVRAWPGPVVDAAGGSVPNAHPLAPLLRLDRATARGGVTWYRAGGQGWLRGFSRARTLPTGALALPGTARIVWHWPTLLVLLADATTLGVVLVGWRRSARPVDATADVHALEHRAPEDDDGDPTDDEGPSR
jgi:hypothetical protein